MRKQWGVVLAVMALTACAAVPSGPMVMVLPGAGKPFDLFQLEDAACRYHAQTQIGVTPGQEPTQSTLSGAAIGTFVGAGLGAAFGAAAGNPEVGAAVGAGTGLLMGTATGAEAGAASARTLQWRYDVSYVQCMYAKGNQVPGTTATPPPHHVPPPPSAPPPPAPGPSPR
jgi:Glycine-zipper domain